MSEMNVVEISKPGGPDVLVPAQRAIPEAGPGEILIKVVAAGVNRPDALQRAGAYDPPPGASDLPGLECSGTVAAVGAGVTRWSVGDEVCALLRKNWKRMFGPCCLEVTLPRLWTARFHWRMPQKRTRGWKVRHTSERSFWLYEVEL